jgi:hypothetical protein
MKKSQDMSGLVQQNGFDPAFFTHFTEVVKATGKPNICERRV